MEIDTPADPEEYAYTEAGAEQRAIPPDEATEAKLIQATGAITALVKLLSSFFTSSSNPAC